MWMLFKKMARNEAREKMMKNIYIFLQSPQIISHTFPSSFVFSLLTVFLALNSWCVFIATHRHSNNSPTARVNSGHRQNCCWRWEKREVKKMFFSSPLWLMMWRWIEGGRNEAKKKRREPAKQLDKTDFHFKQKFLLIVGELPSIMGQFDRTNRWLISAFFHDLSLEVAAIGFLGVWRLAEQLISRPFSIVIARARNAFSVN